MGLCINIKLICKFDEKRIRFFDSLCKTKSIHTIFQKSKEEDYSILYKKQVSESDLNQIATKSIDTKRKNYIYRQLHY